MGEDVLLLYVQPLELHGALAHEKQRRVGVLHDKGQVRGFGAEQIRYGQINEALCKVLCHNICCLVQAIHELGIEPTFGSEGTFDSESELEPKLFA